ncbi:cilia- and flagella-associated protein 299 [Nasonia vitripennis]|uniref:Cilia- and flagella-associated protein 299 n=1 Tax=Nasonia vitripennis TaxID=7425 RepID=A0A7M7LRA7_NASVI|nr:cilia- and flagella-associated protein 299 [Nasonia vitripennis]
MIHKNTQILSDRELLNFRDYKDYLESFITPRDLFHLRSKSIARQIIELGYHTEGTLDRETFEDRVKTIKRYLYLKENPYALCSESIELNDIFLQELGLREKANRCGKMYTIIFMRHFGKSQSQISAYIDYCHRLRAEDWLPYFQGNKKLLPRKDDLSYYDWKAGKSILNESQNFKPIVDDKNGLVFQNTHDLKFVDPNSTFLARTTIYSELYGPIVLYDHNVEIS